MSIRKALVRFETIQKARLVGEEEEGGGEEEDGGGFQQTKSTSKETFVKKVAKQKKGKKNKQKLVVDKGQLSINVPGYKGKQKVSLAKLVQYLPQRRLQQAAKRVLVASGLRASIKKKKKKKATSHPPSLF